jgi:hypothetical protein
MVDANSTNIVVSLGKDVLSPYGKKFFLANILILPEKSIFSIPKNGSLSAKYR